MYSRQRSSKKTKTQIKNDAASIIQRNFKKTQKKTQKKSSETLSPTTHILEEENICNDYKKLLKEKRFDLIAKEFGLAISKIVPFMEKASYDNILIGARPYGISQPGFLGQKVFEHIEEEIEEKSLEDIKSLLEIDTVKAELEKLFNYSQKYLIKPMLKELLNKSFKISQVDINRFLNLHNLDNSGKSEFNTSITHELYNRLVEQGFMVLNNVSKKRSESPIYKTLRTDIENYKFPTFVIKKPGFSKPHATVLKILEKIKSDLNKKQIGLFTIINEYQYPIEGFKKPVRFDILLQKDGTNFGIIEADGIQHYKYTPHFHNPKNDRNNNELGMQRFKELQEKDEIKNNAAKDICSGKECLRLYDFSKELEISQKIKEWIGIDLT